MSVLLVIGGLVLGFVLLVLRSLAIDQVRGQLQRHIRNDVEATIASLPPELQEEWAEEWRAELASAITMPLTAARFARGLRHTARDLVSEPALAHSPVKKAGLPSLRVTQRPRRAWSSIRDLSARIGRLIDHPRAAPLMMVGLLLAAVILKFTTPRGVPAFLGDGLVGLTASGVALALGYSRISRR